VFLLILAVNDAAFYMKTPLFSGVFHTSRERFMTRKERKPASNLVAGISSQTQYRAFGLQTNPALI
jgi:hypothetical protein